MHVLGALFYAATSALLAQTMSPDERPILLIAPSVSVAGGNGDFPSNGERTLDDARLHAFSEAFEEAAATVFEWRRWRVLRCQSPECLAETNTATGANIATGMNIATHRLTSIALRTRDPDCSVKVMLRDLVRGHDTKSLAATIAPCSADNVLSVAMDLGRRIAEGPRLPPRVSLNLTPLPVASLDIPDILDIAPYTTATVARTRKGLDLARSLQIYETQHMIVFVDEVHPERWYVARDRKLLGDCAVRRVASLPITPEYEEHCDGNSWEWAWSGLPAGLFLVLGSASGVGNGDESSIAALLVGMGIAIAAPVLAVGLNVDAADVEEGAHMASRAEIESIVATSNAMLRKTLDLTEAEVTVAGMRL